MPVQYYSIIKETSRGYDSLPISDLLFTSRKLFLTNQVDTSTCHLLLTSLMALNDESPEEEITLYINSPGGDVYSGLGVFDYIRIMKAPLTTVCIGTAASMGALLFLAGSKRLVMEHSQILIHDPSFGGGDMAGLKPHELQKKVDDLKNVRDVTAGIIAEVTDKPLNQILKMTKTDTYLSAQKAIELGLATGMLTE